MLLAVLVLLAASSVFAQSRFVPADTAMAPALRSGVSYPVAHRDSLRKDCIVVFTRNGTSVARSVVGVPGSRRLTQDTNFALRKNSNWKFVSIAEGKVVYLSKNTPLNQSSPPVHLSDLSSYTKVLSVSLDSYNRAEVLPAGKFFVLADKASAEDSAEWGTISWADITGVILPSNEEDY